MAEAMKYGKEEFAVTLPAEKIAAELEPNRVELPQRTVAEHIRYALAHPVDSAPLDQLVHAGETVCIVISDVTRRWQSPETYLPILIEELEKAGIRDEDMLILSATGTHRRQTREEHVGMVTEAVYDRIRVVDHQCEDTENLTYVGTTSFGTPVWLDKRALECDHIILTGGVVYHFMAGFGGGRKSILPGVSGLQTIRHNHAYSLDPKALRSNPKIGNGVLTGNPLHEDMCEAAAMLPHLFMVNLVMNAQMQLHAIFSGHYLKSWEAGCALVNKIYQVDVPEQADVIVASCGGFPKDISLYQGTKTVDNVEPGLKPGGTLILMLEAPEGGGPEEYFGWCQNLLDGTIEKRLREAFTVAGYIFFQNCEQAQRQKIFLYSSIPDELVRPMGMRSFSDMGALLKEADLAGKSIYVIPNGATVVPHVCKEAVL